MKKILLLCALIGICFTDCYSQKIKYYTIEPGENILKIIPKEDFYEYPKFEKGYVYFWNGVKSTSPLNYNFIHEEIYFLDNKGDTLAMSNPEEVKMLTIGNDIFYYADKRFVKSDTVIGEAKLATATFFTIVSNKKIGAFGTTRDAAYSDSRASFVMITERDLNIVPQVITTIARQQALYIGNKFNKFHPVSKKSIFEFYAEKQRQLKDYLKDNKVDYTSRQQVINLLLYMNKL